MNDEAHNDPDPEQITEQPDPDYQSPSVTVDETPASPAKDPAEFFVTRDEKGNLNPVWQDAKEYGQIKVRPMTYGHVERYFGDAGGVAEAGPAVIAEVMRNHVIEPDFEAYARQTYGADYERRGFDHALNESVVRDEMEPLAPMRVLTAVFRASGIDPDVAVSEDGEATVDFGGEGNQTR